MKQGSAIFTHGSEINKSTNKSYGEACNARHCAGTPVWIGIRLQSAVQWTVRGKQPGVLEVMETPSGRLTGLLSVKSQHFFFFFFSLSRHASGEQLFFFF